jgi:glycerol kinase
VADLLLGLDLGSSRVRALALDGAGEVRARAFAPVPVRLPAPGRVEHDPDALVEACSGVLRAALVEAKATAQDVAALGIATQRSTALAWDARSGAALAPAIGWQDQRSAEIEDRLRERGVPPLHQATAAKLAWWLERDPAVASAAAQGRLRVGTPDAWLALRLGGGEAVTDPGQASCTALYDLQRGVWSDVMLERLGLSPDALPLLAATSEVRGETRPSLLGAPVPFAARAGDQQAAAFAQGVAAPGDAKLTLGTGAILDVHAGSEPGAGTGGFPLALWQLADGTRAYCREGNAASAGSAVEWLVRLGLFSSPEAWARAADTADAEGVVCVPALQGLATPWHDPAARGFIGGLTRGTTREQLARAVLEGIAQRSADLVEALEAGASGLRVDGGLARSDRLLQSVADLTRRPVARPAEREATAVGAALLAGLGAGVWSDRAALPARRSGTRVFRPQMPAAEARAARERWRAVVTRRVASPAA